MDLKNDTEFLIGKSLLQVCFGLYQLQLNFKDNVRIEISDSIIYEDLNGTIFTWDFKDGRKPFSINNLIELTITHANLSNNDLILIFSNKERIKIKSGEDNLESYIVHNGNDCQIIY